MINNVDPCNDTPCEWPGCRTRGNPYEDDGWCYRARYYLWLPEGFYCPEHAAFIQEGIQTGYFKDWPRDTSPEVLERLEAAPFVLLDSEEGQRILRNTVADERRAGFRVVHAHEDEEP